MAIRQEREKRGLTQVQVATMSAISVVSYQRIERGQQEPGVQTAILIADALEIKSFKQFKKLFEVQLDAAQKTTVDPIDTSKE